MQLYKFEYFWSHDQSCVYKIVQEIKSLNNVYKLLISWSNLWLTIFSGDPKLQIMLFQLLISWKMSKTFNVMIKNLANIIKTFDLLKNPLLISWLFFQSPEKNNFRSPEIQPHDHFPKYVLANYKMLNISQNFSF